MPIRVPVSPRRLRRTMPRDLDAKSASRTEQEWDPASMPYCDKPSSVQPNVTIRSKQHRTLSDSTAYGLPHSQWRQSYNPSYSFLLSPILRGTVSCRSLVSSTSQVLPLAHLTRYRVTRQRRLSILVSNMILRINPSPSTSRSEGKKSKMFAINRIVLGLLAGYCKDRNIILMMLMNRWFNPSDTSTRSNQTWSTKPRRTCTCARTLWTA